MMIEMTDHKMALKQDASHRQQQAASPEVSVFVSANAGTGKTRVLTSRVLRLLLSGTPPDTILCVTYTKAAAAEMKHRLSAALQMWAVCSTEQLYASLREIGETNPTEKQLNTARRLFALILDFEDSPRIETVHSFCQQILMRFPIEADIPPFFDLIADEEADRLIQDCFLSVVQESYRLSGVLLQDIQTMSDHLSDMLLISHLSAVMKHRELVDKWAHEPAAYAAFSRFLAEDEGYLSETDYKIRENELVADLSAGPVARLATMLNIGGKTAQRRASLLADWLSLTALEKTEKIDIVIQALLSSTQTRLKDIADKAVRQAHPDFDLIAGPVLDDVEALCDARASVICRQLSCAISRLAGELYKRYQHEKRIRGLLDYDDLIFFTRKLLDREQMMAWVRWKLDQGINHLLVDEAQDTSPEQWQLLSRLTDSFFDGSAADGREDRTLFVVGDYKQSIYSFQGARPDVFIDSRQRYQNAALSAGQPFRSLAFDVSFRSSGAVLSFVDAVLAQDEMEGLGAERNAHGVYNADMAGLVEIWDQTRGEEPEKPEAFSVPELPQADRADARHAQRVASHIKELISGSHRQHFGREITPGDILILVHKRNSFYAMLRAELELQGIPVAGADRVRLNNQIEVLDLLALGDICLSPEDDLQLACVLKSPLIGWDEEQLYQLATSRGQRSLYDELMHHAGADTAFGEAADKIRQYRTISENKPVFEFFSTVLATGGREAFYHRLGKSVDDSLNAFLQRARDHASAASFSGQTGLASFISSFRQGGGDIKRDLDARSQHQVRVMTIHGAKGLEAPIVYLPDTLKDRPRAEQVLTDDRGAYWVSSETRRLALISAMKQRDEQNRRQEQQRLLYVALTRAQQALFISGWEQKSSRFEQGSWYQLMYNTLSALAEAIPTGEGGFQLVSGGPAADDHDKKADSGVTVSDAEYGWFYKSPETAPAPARPLNPSDLDSTDSPVAFSGSGRLTALLSGQLAHKLLEILPDIKAERHVEVAQAIAASVQTETSDRLDAEQAEQVISEVMAILTSEMLAPLFSGRALVEVPVSGLVGTVAVAGQIDRMLVTDETVTIIDYKTGAPPPQGQRPQSRYISQMAAYGALISEIYPGRKIDCYLLWCQNQSLTVLTEQEREEAVSRMQASASASASGLAIT